MKKLVLISSHCDTDDKLKILKTNLNILRSMNVKILLYSSFRLNSEITDFVDYYFYNSINPINESRSMLFWKEEIYNNKKIKFFRFWRDHTLAGFYQLKYLSNLSKMLNFDLNYFILYDLVITNDVICFIKDKEDEGFFSFLAYENGEEKINDCATQLYCINKDNIDKLNEYFDWNECQRFSNIEGFMFNLANRLNIPVIRDFTIEDHIYQFRNWREDFYNYSPWSKFKIYFSKNVGTNDPHRIMIYDIKEPVELFIRIDDDIQKIKIEDIQVYEIKSEYQNFELWLDGKVFDALENVSKFPGGTWEIL
jgi:hypothetical protein